MPTGYSGPRATPRVQPGPPVGASSSAMNATATVLVLSLLGAPPAAGPDPLCAKREPCTVVETLDAGKDAQGRPLQVKHLELGWADVETSDEFLGRKFGPGGRKEEGSRAEGQCEAAEWWLVHPSQPAQLLLSVCNNGYGAAGVGEDLVTVADNRFTHEQSGGSRQRWSVSRTLQLSPLRLVIEGHRSSDSMSEEEKEEGDYWDLEQLRGEVVRAAPECEPGEPSLGARTLPYLPQVQVDKAYLQDGWKQAGLGTCGFESGNFLLGNQDDPKDAALKALLVAPDTLLVEVRTTSGRARARSGSTTTTWRCGWPRCRPRSSPAAASPRTSRSPRSGASASPMARCSPPSARPNRRSRSSALKCPASRATG